MFSSGISCFLQLSSEGLASQVVDKLPLGRILGTSLDRAKSAGGHKLVNPPTLFTPFVVTMPPATLRQAPVTTCPKNQALCLGPPSTRTCPGEGVAASSGNSPRKPSPWGLGMATLPPHCCVPPLPPMPGLCLAPSPEAGPSQGLCWSPGPGGDLLLSGAEWAQEAAVN